MGNSALGRGTAIEENKVKASSGDGTPNFLDGKVGNSIKVVSNLLEMGFSGQVSGDMARFDGTNWVRTPAGIVFEVTKSATQSLSNGVETKVTWDTERIDSHSYFASDRFTPLVSGYYHIHFQAIFNLLAGSNAYIIIKKNTSIVSQMQTKHGATGNDGNSTNIIVSMNGTTDYIEAYVQQDSGVTADLGGDTYTRLMGFRIL